MEKILLVDGSHLARRNYHAQQLSTSDGLATGLIYGMVNSLISVYNEDPFDLCIVAWDTKTSSMWRKEIYPEYKGNRTAPEESFLEQLELVKALLDAMGICQIEKEGAEADDIIGFLSRALPGKKVILSGDEDFLALIREDVSVLSSTKGLIELEKDGKITKTLTGGKLIRLRPDQMVDYKCLVGDSSDNIPGAKGFGPGAAIKYFTLNEGIQNILDGTVNLSNQTNSAINGMLGAISELPVFKEIITISEEKGSVEELVVPEMHKEKVRKLFDLFEFNSFKVLGDTIFNIGGNSEGITLNK